MQLTKKLRAAPSLFAHFLGVDSTARDVALISGSTTKRHELPTAATTRSTTLQVKPTKRQGTPAATASRQNTLNRTKASMSTTPFADRMRGYVAPAMPAAHGAPVRGLTDRQKITATRADVEAASQRVDTLRKKLSDTVWNATLAGKRANPTEMDRLRRQIERAEAEHKALGKTSAEAAQRALASKSSAVRAVLTFPQE